MGFLQAVASVSKPVVHDNFTNATFLSMFYMLYNRILTEMK